MCFGVLLVSGFFFLPSRFFSLLARKKPKKRSRDSVAAVLDARFWHLTDGNTGLWAGRESEATGLVGGGRSRRAARALDRRPAGVSCRGGCGVSEAAAASVKVFPAAYTPRSCTRAATRVIASISLAQQAEGERESARESWDSFFYLFIFLHKFESFGGQMFLILSLFCQTDRCVCVCVFLSDFQIGYVWFKVLNGAAVLFRFALFKLHSGRKEEAVFHAQQEVWRRSQQHTFSCFRKSSNSLTKKKKKSIRGHLSEVWRFTVNNGAQINSRATLLVINTTSALNLIYRQNSCSDVKGEKK